MSDTLTARRVVLSSHPRGGLQPSDFAVEAMERPAIGDGQFLVRNLYVSVDPMLRLFIDPAPFGGAMPPMPLGTTIPGPAVGEVIESRHPDFAIGDLVESRFGWQDYAISNGLGVNRVSAGIGSPENALGVGGLPGFTAYVGLETAGGVKEGQTWLVSGAAGAVGSVVGGLVSARGGRAVGIASGAEKCRYLVEEAGYAAAADRAAPDFLGQLKAALPTGANIYFDNVGGPMLAQVVPFLARGAQVLICGLMSQYQEEGEATGPDHLPAVLRAVMMNGVSVRGFTQAGQDALRPAFEAEIASLLASGKLAHRVTVEQGIERLPHALCGLFEHGVPGKVVVHIADPVGARTKQEETA